MSAYLVSKQTIDAVVMACRIANVAGDLSDDDLGRLLWRENVASLHGRYTDPSDLIGDENVDAYTFENPKKQLSVMALLKITHCYQYQSCEHAGWYESRAREITAAVERALSKLMCVVPINGVWSDLPAWHEAPWGLG